jgi:hypothetical protein
MFQSGKEEAGGSLGLQPTSADKVKSAPLWRVEGDMLEAFAASFGRRKAARVL